MSWVFVLLRMVSDVYGTRDTRLLWRLAYWRSGSSCGGIIQFAYDRQTRVWQGKLLSKNPYFFPSRHVEIFIFEMLVVGAFIQIVAFLVECLAPPFPVFALSFTLAGMGNVFQVNVIYIQKELRLIISLSTRSSLHLQMPSSQLFKRTLITNKVMYRLHMVHLSPPNLQLNPDVFHTIH